MRMSEVPKEYFVKVDVNTLISMFYNLVWFLLGNVIDNMEYVCAEFQKTYNIIRYVLGLKERNLYKLITKRKAQLEAVCAYYEIRKEWKNSFSPDVEPNLAEMNKVLLSVAASMNERITIYEWKFPIDSLLRNFHKKEFISKIKPNCFTTNIVNLCEKFSNIYSNILIFNADNLVMLRQNLNKDPPFY